MSSIYPRSHLEPETLSSIERYPLRFSAVSKRDEYECGCMPWGDDHIYLCEWHQGYDTGVEAMKESKP